MLYKVLVVLTLIVLCFTAAVGLVLLMSVWNTALGQDLPMLDELPNEPFLKLKYTWKPALDDVISEGWPRYKVWAAYGDNPTTFMLAQDVPTTGAILLSRMDLGKLWLKVTAYDAAGNESEASVPISVLPIDTLTPTVPIPIELTITYKITLGE